MIRAVGPRSWCDVPPQVVIRFLRRLQARRLYGPQDLVPALSSLAFRNAQGNEDLTIAIEGLDLAVQIGDALSLDYCIYNDEQATIRGIECAAISRLRERGRLR